MIDRNKILAMIDHWFNGEINGYFGSPYGPDLNSLLMGPLDSPVANEFKQDIPILQQLSADELALYSQNEGFETKVIYLKVGDVAINLNQIRDSQLTMQGETYDADAS